MMASFTVSFKVPDKIKEMPELIDKGIDTGIRESTKFVTNEAIDLAHRRTGTLKRSIHAIIGVQKFVGRVVQDIGVAKYGPFVEHGTGIYAGKQPYEITPKRKKALYWRGAKHPVRKVIHQGSRPYPYMKPASEKTGLLMEIMQKELDDVAREFGGK